MTYSTPPTEATGNTLAAGDWNTYVRDNFEDHEARIRANTFAGAVVTRASDQSIPNAAFTAITWTAETTDQGGWITTSSTTFTVPSSAIVAGYSSITVSFGVSIYWDGNTTGGRGIRFMKNGTAYAGDTRDASPGDMGITIVAPDIVAGVGDTFTCEIYQDSGGALNAIGGTFPLMATIRRASYF